MTALCICGHEDHRHVEGTEYCGDCVSKPEGGGFSDVRLGCEKFRPATRAVPTQGPAIGPVGGSGQAKERDFWQPGQIRVYEARLNPCTGCGGSGFASGSSLADLNMARLRKFASDMLRSGNDELADWGDDLAKLLNEIISPIVECSDTCTRQVCEWCPGPEGAAANREAAEGYEMRLVGSVEAAFPYADFLYDKPGGREELRMRLRVSRAVWESQGSPTRLWIHLEYEPSGDE